MADAQAAPPNLPMTRYAKGRLATLAYRVSRVLHLLSGGRVRLDIYLLCAQPLRAESALRPSGSTELRQVAADDVLVRDFPRPPQVNQARFDAGHACYVAKVKDQFAGHIWIAFGSYDEDMFRCRYQLPPDGCGVWDFDVYVEPKFRMGRTAALLWGHVERTLHARGAVWSFSRISLFNTNSVQVHERLGARQVGSCLFLAIGPVQLALHSRAPFAHVSFSKAARANLQLTPPPVRR